jgi:two-component system NtrC family sensor kinase
VAARGLKTKIAINITMFLLLGMLSIDLVTMMTAQRNLIRAETAKGKAVARLIGDYLRTHPIWEDFSQQADAKAHLGRTLAEAGASCFFLLNRNQQQMSFGAGLCGSPEEILANLQKTLTSGSDNVFFTGSTFGFFWMQHEYLVVTTPLRENGDIIAGFSLVFSLDAIYDSLRHSQQMLLVYIFVNTAVLAFVGIYRVFKLYLQPLARLAQRAEDYKKEKLRATVASLEAANAELKKAQTEIIRAEKLASVGRLSAGIAHEIGNPIGIVTGYLELLKQADLPADERAEYMDRAEQEIERISAIIRQLLEISRPSHGGPQHVSVHGIIGNMAQVLNVQPFMSHMRLITDLGASRDDVLADPNQLRQVFLNLIINAADAISAKGPRAEGELVVMTDNSTNNGLPDVPARHWLRIHFRDNGSGIPEENLTNIFDPFFTTKEPGKGTGLGLAVSFMIIESFGGRMQVESEVGQGTCMTVSLPAVG